MSAKKAQDANAAVHPKAPLVVFGLGLATLLGTGILSMALAERGLGKVALCALFTEWMCGRAGVAWVDPSKPRPNRRAVVLSVLHAVGLAGGVALAAIALGLATGALSARAQAISPEGLLLSLFSSFFFGMRVTLTEHGIVFAMLFGLTRLLPAQKHWVVFVLVGTAASLAGALGRGETGLAIVVTGAVGAVGSALWSVDRGALRAIAFRGACTFFLGSFARLGPAAVMAGTKTGLATSPEANVFVCVAALAALSLVRPRTHARTVAA